MQSKSSRRGFILVVGFLCMMLLGLVYAWSIFADYLAQAASTTTESISPVFGILMIFFCLGCLLSSYVQRKIGVKKCILISAFLVGLGFIATAFTMYSGVIFIFLCYGVFVGLGCGFGYNSIVSTVNSWFSDKVGFSSGLLLLGYGFGALIFGTLAQKMIQSSFGLHNTLLVIAVVIVCAFCFAATVLIEPKNEANNASSQKSSTKISRTSFTTHQMFCSRTFQLQLIWYVCSALAPLVLIGSAKQGATTLGISTEVAVILVGVVSVANGFSRIVYGLIYDNLGLSKVMAISTSCSLLGCATIVLAFVQQVQILYIAGAIILGFAYGGLPICSSTLSMSRYGLKYYSSNYALATSCMIPTAAIQVFVMPFVSGLLGIGMQFIFLGALAVIGLITLAAFAKRYKKEMEELTA